jgi:predicted deacylase
MFKSDALLSKEERNSYEYDRAQYLKQHLRSANALLDIHASNTPESRPFLICEQNAYGIANELPIDLIVSGFDVLQPGGTDCYMNAHGKIGMCVECGYAKDPDGLNIAEEYLFSFLIAQGNLLGSTKKRKQSHIQMKSMYLTKTDRFSLVKDFDDFEKVKAGQIIGTDGDEMITAPSDAIILFARNRDKISEEAFLLGKA